ncbi:uncharacterized protein LOC129723165 isoform X2 [Wyeomyia smithii]|uniref:uncharacterized protein LOC129723165 isoform X2 n=1 Tax=Wyeomyia smithii TaxID=174621 RepID=UPI0024681E0D|nr:uncharacterized protein LOC129723165 isoform X2 [Wyeomyia smithii]
MAPKIVNPALDIFCSSTKVKSSKMIACEKLDNNNLAPNFGITAGTGNNNNSSENIFIDIPTPSTRSISPLSSTSPGKDKSYGFFQNIYRKISLKSSDEISNMNRDEDSRSSSVDSCSSLSDRLQPVAKRQSSHCVKSTEQILALELSSTSSDSVSNSSRDADKSTRTSRRSSMRKLLENLNINTPARTRSLSCSSTSVNILNQKSLKQKTESKSSLFNTSSSTALANSTPSKPPPKKILRRPVSYTYLRGISGLPTQRVPRSSICCSYYGR